MGETPCLLSIFTPRKRRLLVLLGGTLVADRQQHFLLTGSGLAGLLAFRRPEIRQDQCKSSITLSQQDAPPCGGRTLSNCGSGSLSYSHHLQAWRRPS